MADFPDGIRMSGNTIVTGSVPGECILTVGYSICGKAFSGTARIVVTQAATPYPGPYTVIPEDEEQTLETDGLLMTEDVVIMPVPRAQVPNAAGGYTVEIG